MTLRIRNEFAVIWVLGLVLLGLIAADDLAISRPLPTPLALLHLSLGLAFVLFFPGYALQTALFPRGDDLETPERLAYSVGLSVAVVPPLALILDALPWGLRLEPIVATEALFIAICSALAWWQRAQLPPEERLMVTVAIDLNGWWAALDRTDRILYTVLLGALLLAGVSAVGIALLPKAGEQFTEFYILGAEGLAQSYPRNGGAGEPLTVTLGITNREGKLQRYRVAVENGTHPIGGTGPIGLKNEETYEAPMTFLPVEVGEDVQVNFLLYREGDEKPYRSLRLWLKVTE